MKNLPSQETLIELLHYEPETGLLFWRERDRHWFESDRIWRSWNTRLAGKEALATIVDGYRVGAVLGVPVKAHRVIFKMQTGEDPVGIDHIDGDPGNNRWSNLRAVTQAENCRNRRRRTDNASGVTGVYWSKDMGKWRGEITVDGKAKYLGYFETFEEAVAVRKAAEIEHNFHANHGRAA